MPTHRKGAMNGAPRVVVWMDEWATRQKRLKRSNSGGNGPDPTHAMKPHEWGTQSGLWVGHPPHPRWFCGWATRHRLFPALGVGGTETFQHRSYWFDVELPVNFAEPIDLKSLKCCDSKKQSRTSNNG